LEGASRPIMMPPTREKPRSAWKDRAVEYELLTSSKVNGAGDFLRKAVRSVAGARSLCGINQSS
jgi:hypothetical protein